MAKTRKRITILENDPHKDFKLEIVELIKNEINYTVNKLLVRVLLWVVIIIIPVGTGWAIVQYNNNKTINEITENRDYQDSIINSVAQQSYERHLDRNKLQSSCLEIENLKSIKADKIDVDATFKSIQDQLDRSRHFETEMLKRQDLMLQHLLDVKKSL